MSKELSEVQPKPLGEEELESVPSDDDGCKVFGIPIFGYKTRRGLHLVQKYSTIPMSVYFPLHAINTMVVPLFGPESACNEVLMMVRELFDSKMTAKILIVSLGLHITSGLLCRLIDGIRNRKFSSTAISGYVLFPLLSYHIYLMIYGPQIDIDFNYVKWILQNPDWMIKWVGGIVPLALLIQSGTFHMFSGASHFWSVSRKKMMMLSRGLFGLGLISIFRLSRSIFSSFDSAAYIQVFQKLRLL